MFSRKSLFVALTVIAMLAMLVPAAMAAPEVLTGVAITSPTTVNPALITTPTDLAVKYDVTIAGTQVNDVHTTAWLLDSYGNTMAQATQVIQAVKLATGVNHETITLAVPALADGWYGLRVCVVERNERGGIISDPCTTQPRSVQVDNTAPVVTLERPAPAEGCTWVTGKAYELFGMATDNVAVDMAWFELSATQNADDVIKIANGVAVAGFPGEYTALWDSTQVPDGSYWIRFVAVDTAGNKSWTAWQFVCVENRVKIDLQKGWNLISTPLLLYNNTLSDIFTNHLWNTETFPMEQWGPNDRPIDMVVTTRDGGATWTSNMPGGTLTAIEDGYGYWVHVVAPTTIEFVGTWLSVGPNPPPEYPVHAGWNLIGYTHFGAPTPGPWTPADHPAVAPQAVADYLGYPMMVSVESMYRYDARAGRYIEVDEAPFGQEQFMTVGAGYWLALAQGTEGTINP